MKRKYLIIYLIFVFFAIPSCVDIPENDDPEEEEEEVIDEDGNTSSAWKFLAVLDKQSAGWGFFSDLNLEVDKSGNAFVMYTPQYSVSGGGQGYAAVITDSAKYEIETFTPAVFGSFNKIETDMYNNSPYVCFFNYRVGFPEIDVKKRENGKWIAIDGEVVESDSYCDDEFDFAIGKNGDLFVAFGKTFSEFDAVGRPIVRKFSGNKWTTLGGGFISDSIVSYINMAVGSDNTPYIFYREVGSNDKKSKKAVVQYFNGSKWVKCGNYISNSEQIANMSIVVIGDKPYIAYNETDNKKSYIKYWNGSSWMDAGTSRPFSFHTKLQSFNGELYVGSRDDYGYVSIERLDGKTWKSYDKEGISRYILSEQSAIDFKVNDKGIYLLSSGTSTVIYNPSK